ncbi:MAG TPA: hypothetical protein VK459_05925, partial [Polyangiaceae bacterium]|nr:hypothetical protein [Polyangiaceae bacterium]
MKPRIPLVSRCLLGLSAPIAALLLGCQGEPPSLLTPPEAAAAVAPVSTSPIQSVRKLDGAPSRVIEARFAPDGASLLVFELRRPKDDDSDDAAPGASTFAISRRPLAGGPTKDLMASEALSVVDFAPLGDGVLAILMPAVPPSKADEPDDPDAYWQASKKSAVYRIGNDGGEPVRVSPEGRRCINLVGAANGQRVAYSMPPKERQFWAPVDVAVETRVIGPAPGDETTLTIEGPVQDMSPDGSHVLVRRAPELPTGVKSWGPKSSPLSAPPPRSNVKSLVIVNVKDQAVTPLPLKLSVDGATIDVGEFSAIFLADGLLFRSPEGELY